LSKFSEFMLAARQRAGLSTREIERLSGVSKAYISQMETGGRNVPTPDILRKLAPHLKVSYEDLMKAAGLTKYLSHTSITVAPANTNTSYNVFINVTQV